ncbi:MAG: hypothetical protein ACI9JN_000653 [Bacteroidia bacterium]|jgi:hypothetical protein
MQSRRYAFIFIALAALVIGLYFLKSKTNQHDLPADFQNFAVEHPEEITMIFMTNQAGDKQIYLRKQEDATWTINDKYPAWQKKVDFLLNETMAKVEVQGPAANAAVENILKYMSINGTKVEVYRKNNPEPDKVYIVGNTTPSQLGTYFKFMGDHKPMIMQIPGFNGFVNSRFELDEDEWVSPTVFGSSKQDITSVEVTYPDSSKNFTIKHLPDDKFAMTSASISEDNKNTGAIKSYLTLFEKLNYETFVYTTSDSLKESLNLQEPFCSIRVESKNRGIDELKFYYKKPGEKMHGLYDKDGNAMVTDPSRYYGLYNKIDQVLIVQDYTFGKVLQTADDFLNRSN